MGDDEGQVQNAKRRVKAGVNVVASFCLSYADSTCKVYPISILGDSEGCDRCWSGRVCVPPQHVRTPTRTKSTTHRGGKSPKTAVCLRDQLLIEGAEGKEETKAEAVPHNCCQLHDQKRRRSKKNMENERRRGRKSPPLPSLNLPSRCSRGTQLFLTFVRGSGSDTTTSW